MIKSLPNLYSFLYLSEKEVSFLLSKIEEYYTPKCQAKKKYGRPQRNEDGTIKMRNLLVPEYILKSRQKRIAKLLHKISLPDYMYGSTHKKNNVTNAICHWGHKFFFKVDLKNFFPNITHKQVFSMFMENNFSPSVSHCLTKLTTYKYSLPQGAPSSPVIANLVFRNTGNKLAAIAHKENLTFTTYLDDLIFSANHSFHKLIPVIKKILKDDYFYPAQKKIKYVENYCEITGIYVHPYSLELPFEMQNEALRNKKLREYQEVVEYYSNSISN